MTLQNLKEQLKFDNAPFWLVAMCVQYFKDNEDNIVGVEQYSDNLTTDNITTAEKILEFDFIDDKKFFIGDGQLYTFDRSSLVYSYHENIQYITFLNRTTNNNIRVSTSRLEIYTTELTPETFRPIFYMSGYLFKLKA